MRTIPKVIENLREALLQEARKELFEEGYQALNIRTVAARCEAAVGTFYNYFPSKEMLAASVVLEDWRKTQKCMNEKLAEETELFAGIRIVYEELLKFEQLYHDIFQNSRMVYSKYSSKERHLKLREQLEEPLKLIFKKADYQVDAFTLSFLAENLLGFCQERVAYEKLEVIFQKLFS